MQREKNLDYLKGVCIIFIIITHYAWTQEERLVLGFPFWIDMAVPFFMLVTGYVYAMSYSKKGIDTLDKSFTFKRLFEQFIRFTVPFLIAFLVECVVCLFGFDIVGQPAMTIKEFVVALLTGSWGPGPGSYYYPVMIQFIFIYPFIYMLIKKHQFKGLLILFLLNIFWEVIKIPYEITSAGYRLIMFRYIFLIGYGSYVFQYCREENRTSSRAKILYAVCVVIGIAFIIYASYLEFPTYIFEEWTGTCVVACLWILPIFRWIASKRKWNIKLPLDVLGKCSYEIFLVQMVYYNLVQGYKSLFEYKGIFLTITILICAMVGWILYKFDTLLIGKVTVIMRKKVERRDMSA